MYYHKLKASVNPEIVIATITIICMNH